MSKIPSLEEIKKHFDNAKVVMCFFQNDQVNIEGTDEIDAGYCFLDKSWAIVGSTDHATVWKNGNYAEIIEHKVN